MATAGGYHRTSDTTIVLSGNDCGEILTKGTAVDLRAISGHRDTYGTSCPGNNVYAQLPSITRQVAATGSPKIYSPLILGAVGGNVRFTARLSSAVPWTVTVTDSLGRIAASGTGTTATVDWTWDASRAVPGRYTYTIAAGGVGVAAARPVRGVLGNSLLPVTVTQLRVDPTVVSPNGDGVGDTAHIVYFLSASAPVIACVAVFYAIFVPLRLVQHDALWFVHTGRAFGTAAHSSPYLSGLRRDARSSADALRLHRGWRALGRLPRRLPERQP